jgi:hypothetical protein
MRTDGNEVHVSEEEASGGSKEGVVRWVLIGGLVLAIGALSLIWIGGALSSTDPDADNANVSAKIAAQKDADRANEEAPLPVQTSDSEQKVRNNLNVVEN